VAPSLRAAKTSLWPRSRKSPLVRRVRRPHHSTIGRAWDEPTNRYAVQITFEKKPLHRPHCHPGGSGPYVSSAMVGDGCDACHRRISPMSKRSRRLIAIPLVFDANGAEVDGPRRLDGPAILARHCVRLRLPDACSTHRIHVQTGSPASSSK
jgi:hypothetical protein